MARTDSLESFIRWQAILREQLTFANNLILTFAVASLGFVLTLLQNDPAKALCTLWAEFFAAIFLTASILFGIALVVNRLKDFRTSTRIAKQREAGANDAQLETDRITAEQLGGRTWCLFWWQIATFTMGAAAAAIAVMLPIATRLF